jgi:hypothetical protein
MMVTHACSKMANPGAEILPTAQLYMRAHNPCSHLTKRILDGQSRSQGAHSR